MSSTAHIGFAVDTRDIDRAEKRLNALGKAGKSVESTGGLIQRSMSSAGASAQKSGGLIQQSMNSAGASSQKAGGLIQKSMSSSSRAIDGVAFSGRNMVSMLKQAKGAIAGLGLLALASNALQVGNAFESSMNTVQSKLQISTYAMQDLREQAKDLGATTSFSASQAADGMGYLAQAGLNAKEIISAMPHTLNLAAAASMDLAQSADIATNVMGSFAMGVGDLPRIVDVLAVTSAEANTSVQEMASAIKQAGPVAVGLGVDIYETSAAIGILANNGFKGEQAGMVLKNMFLNLVNPVGEGKKALDSLNITQNDLFKSMEDGSLKFRGMTNMMEVLQESGAQSADVMRIFGREAGPGVASLISSGSKAIERLEENISDSGEAARMAAIRMQGLPGALKAASSAWEGLNIAVMEAGGNRAVIIVLDGITAALRGSIEWVNLAARRFAEFQIHLQYSNDRYYVMLRGIGDAFEFVSDAIQPSLQYLGEFALSITLIVGTAKTLSIVTGAFTALAAAAKGVGATVMLMNPVTAAAIALAGVALTIYNNWDQVKQLFSGFWDRITADTERATRAFEGVSDVLTDNTRAAEKHNATMSGFLGTTGDAIRGAAELSKAVQDHVRSLEDATDETDRARDGLDRYNTAQTISTLQTLEQDRITEGYFGTTQLLQRSVEQLGLAYKGNTKELSELTNTSEEAQRVLEKLDQALEKKRILLTQGEDAARVYELSIAGLTKELAKEKAAEERSLQALEDKQRASAQLSDTITRLKQSIEKNRIAVTQGDEAARRYELSIDGITGSTQDAIVEGEMHVETLREQEKQSEKARQNLDNLNESLKLQRIRYVEGEEAARRYELEQKNITGSAQDTAIALEKEIKALAEKDRITKKVTEELEDLKQAQRNQNIELTQGAEAAERARLVLEGYEESQINTAIAIKGSMEAQKEFHTALVDSIKSADSIKDVFTNLGDWMKDWLKDKIAHFAANTITAYLGLGSTGGGGIGDIFGSLLGGGGGGGGGLGGIGNIFSGVFGGGGTTDYVADIYGGGAAASGGMLSNLNPIAGALTASLAIADVVESLAEKLGAANAEAVGIGTALLGPLGGLVGSLFGGKTEMTDAGVNLSYSGTGGLDGYSYADYKEKKSFWRGTDRWTEFSELNAELEETIGDYLDTMHSTIVGQAEALGIAGAESILDSFETATREISHENAEEEISQWLQDTTRGAYMDAFQDLPVELKPLFSDMIKGIGIVESTGDVMGEAADILAEQTDAIAARFEYVATVAQTLTPLMQELGLNISDSFHGAIADSVMFADAMGGIENAVGRLTFYIQEFVPSVEQARIVSENAAAQVYAWNAEIGRGGETIETSWRLLQNYTSSLDRSTVSGQLAMEQIYAFSEMIDVSTGKLAVNRAALDLYMSSLDLNTEAGRMAYDTAMAFAQALNINEQRFEASQATLDEYAASLDGNRAAGLAAIEQLQQYAIGVDEVTGRVQYSQEAYQGYIDALQRYAVEGQNAVAAALALADSAQFGGEGLNIMRSAIDQYRDSLDLNTSAGQLAYEQLMSFTAGLDSTSQTIFVNREALDAYIASLDLTTAAGQAAYQSAIALSDAINLGSSEMLVSTDAFNLFLRSMDSTIIRDNYEHMSALFGMVDQASQTIPVSREALEAFASSLDTTTEAGRVSYEALMTLSESMNATSSMVLVSQSALDAYTATLDANSKTGAAALEQIAAFTLGIDQATGMVQVNREGLMAYIASLEAQAQTHTEAYDAAVALAEAVGITTQTAITSREQFYEYIQSLDMTTEAGQQAAAAAYEQMEAIIALEEAQKQAKLTLDTVTDAARTLNLNFDATSPLAISASSALVELMGGLDAFTAATQNYFNQFYSMQEQQDLALAQAASQVSVFNESLGLTGAAAIDTTEEFRRYVESLDLTTEEGRKAFAAAMELSDAMATVANSGMTLTELIGSLPVNLQGAFELMSAQSISTGESLTNAAETIDSATVAARGSLDNLGSAITSVADVTANAAGIAANAAGTAASAANSAASAANSALSSANSASGQASRAAQSATGASDMAVRASSAAGTASNYAIRASEAANNASRAASDAASAARTAARSVQVDGSHATGLGSVPFDGYIGELHRGEMILPSNVASWFRNVGVPVHQPAVNDSSDRNSGGRDELVVELKAMRKEIEQMRQDNQASNRANTNALNAISVGTDRQTSVLENVDRTNDRLSRKITRAVS